MAKPKNQPEPERAPTEEEREAALDAVADEQARLAAKAAAGRPPHQLNAPRPNEHNGAPCTNCGVSEIKVYETVLHCDYCGYEWERVR